MNKRILTSLFFSLLFFGLLFGYCYQRSYQILKINSIQFLEYNGLDETMKVEIKKERSFFHKTFLCEAQKEDGSVVTSNGENDKCELELSLNDHYLISISDEEIKSEEYDSTQINKKETNYKKEILYLGIGEKANLSSVTDGINDTFYSTDESIFKVEDGKIVALAEGSAYLYSTNSISKLKVSVTRHVTNPILNGGNKQKITCGVVTPEENDILDQMLEERVEAAGYGTRAGAVAAARFLTMQFAYKIPYFYENGRIHESGVNYADGEGRYYHKGLYLSEKKFDTLEATFSGPATWGCPLWNWEDEPTYGFIKGTKMPNGLDCSGFVSWVLKNAGFDPGDIGAGESEYPYQMTDLAEFVPLTDELMESGRIKVGDLFNIWGHISILVGMDENYYYIAESLQDYGGVVVRTYDHQNVKKWFHYVVLMDSYYQEDGNYSEMWNDVAF